MKRIRSRENRLLFRGMLLAVSMPGWMLVARSSAAEPLTLKTQGGAPTALAVSPDGRRVAFCSHGELSFWDTQSGKVKRIGDDRGRFSLEFNRNDLQFSPDGKTLLMLADSDVDVMADATIQLLDPHTGRLRRELPVDLDNGFINALVFSPDGKTLATAGMGVVIQGTARGVPGGGSGGASGRDSGKTSILLWDTATGRRRQKIQLQEAPWKECYDLAFSPDGATLAAATDDDTTRIWDVATGKLKQTFQRAKGYQLAFSRDAKTLVSAFSEGSQLLVVRWDLASGKGTPTIRRTFQDRSFSAVRLSPYGDTFATAQERSKIYLWDTQTGKESGELAGHPHPIEGLAFSADQRVLAAGAVDGTMKVWKLEPGQTQPVAGEKPKPRAKPDGALRTWTSADGKFQVEAQLVQATKEQVTLKRKDGKTIQVPIGRLGSNDQAFVHKLSQKKTRQARQAVVAADALQALGAKLSKSGGHVTRIDFNGAKITDGDLAHLAPFEHLKALDLAQTGVTDAGLVHLKGLTTLVTLDLSETQVTDAGLAHLEGLTQLKKLVTVGSKISSDARAALLARQKQVAKPANQQASWSYSLTPLQGQPYLDTPGVAILFEDMAMLAGTFANGQLQVAGPGYPAGLTELGAPGSDRITLRRSYAGGVGMLTIENRGRSHTLEISEQGTKLTIDAKHKFDLAGGKKLIIIDAEGKPRLDKRRIPASGGR